MDEPANCQSNFWLHALVLPDSGNDDLLKITNEQRIYCRPLWVPMHKLPYFADAPKMDLSKAEEIQQRVVNLPSSVGLV